MYIRFSTCEMRRLKRALVKNNDNLILLEGSLGNGVLKLTCDVVLKLFFRTVVF